MSSAYKAAASSAMLVGQNWCSADDSNVASLPYQGIASPSMLAERNWSRELDSNQQAIASEATEHVPCPREIGPVGVNRTPRSCVRSAGTVSNGDGNLVAASGFEPEIHWL